MSARKGRAFGGVRNDPWYAPVAGGAAAAPSIRMLELLPLILLGYIVLLGIPATRPYAMGPIALLPGTLTARRTPYPEHRPWAQLELADLPDRARAEIDAHAHELERRGFVLSAVRGQ